MALNDHQALSAGSPDKAAQNQGKIPWSSPFPPRAIQHKAVTHTWFGFWKLFCHINEKFCPNSTQFSLRLGLNSSQRVSVHRYTLVSNSHISSWPNSTARYLAVPLWALLEGLACRWTPEYLDKALQQVWSQHGLNRTSYSAFETRNLTTGCRREPLKTLLRPIIHYKGTWQGGRFLRQVLNDINEGGRVASACHHQVARGIVDSIIKQFVVIH